MKNDLQAVADDILSLTTKIAPDLLKIEEGKELLRDATEKAGEPLTFSSALGAVVTKRGSPESTKRVIEVNAAAFDALSPEFKAILTTNGVITVSMKKSAARKPSVEVKPASTVPAQQAA